MSSSYRLSVRAALISNGDLGRKYTSGYEIHEGDVMMVKVTGFTHDVILPGDTVHIYFFKNGNQVIMFPIFLSNY